MLPGMRPFANFVTPATISHTDTTSSEENTTSYTFSGRAIGAAATGRRVVVATAFTAPASQDPTITVGGVSCTKLLLRASSNGQHYVGLYICTLATGTTADIVITMSGTSSRCGVALYAVYNLLLSTARATASVIGNPKVLSMTSLEDSVCVAATFEGNNTTTNTWSGLTENVDIQIEAAATFSAASAAFASEAFQTITCQAAATDATRRAGTAVILR